MGRKSGGRKIIILVIGHPTKKTTSQKWARQAERRGKGQIIDSILYWHTGQALQTHRDRELRQVEALRFEMGGKACDLTHEHSDDAEYVHGGPEFRTIQLESSSKEWVDYLRKQAGLKTKARA